MPVYLPCYFTCFVTERYIRLMNNRCSIPVFFMGAVLVYLLAGGCTQRSPDNIKTVKDSIRLGMPSYQTMISSGRLLKEKLSGRLYSGSLILLLLITRVNHYTCRNTPMKIQPPAYDHY